jgi:hypothetical protein
MQGAQAGAQEAATRQNPTHWNFPLDSQIDTVYCSNEKPESGSDRWTRRMAIAQCFRILMLFGDNLGDFLSDVRDGLSCRIQLMEAGKARRMDSTTR